MQVCTKEVYLHQTVHCCTFIQLAPVGLRVSHWLTAERMSAAWV